MTNPKYFLDTNIFVYSFDATQPSKQRISQHLIREALEQQVGCTSYQVVQEFLNVATRKFTHPLSLADVQHYLNRVLEPLCEIHSSMGLYHQALEIATRWKYAFYDSLIITAALNSRCQILYSEDLQDGQRLTDLFITNPFKK